MTTYSEANFDGLVGPSHHYAGLSKGNIASINHAHDLSNPKEAALQGLQKMDFLHSLGLKQGFLPPHPRPNLRWLHQLGFTGTPEQQIQTAFKKAPKLLSMAYSASSMWTANAATVTAPTDSPDGKTHFTTANLITHPHRAEESYYTERMLQYIFSDERYFIHHDTLPKSLYFSDEGAANHCRLHKNHESTVNLFIFGKTMEENTSQPKKFPARQTKEASEAIARSHQLNASHVIFAQQNPKAIDLGVFHHDVIGMSNENLMIVHEHAFYDQKDVCSQLQSLMPSLQLIEVKASQFTMMDAIQSYFFNAQLVTLPNKSMLLLLPKECEEHPKVSAFLPSLYENTPIQAMEIINLRQSMRNGGGPACLRLRVPLSHEAYQSIKPEFLINEKQIALLTKWIETYYRDRLSFQDLQDKAFLNECLYAHEALTKLLNLP